MTYLNARTGKPETVTATKSGFETIYSANRAYLTYLEALANRLGIILDPASTQ